MFVIQLCQFYLFNVTLIILSMVTGSNIMNVLLCLYVLMVKETGKLFHPAAVVESLISLILLHCYTVHTETHFSALNHHTSPVKGRHHSFTLLLCLTLSPTMSHLIRPVYSKGASYKQLTITVHQNSFDIPEQWFRNPIRIYQLVI